jgi:hypothetical protein
MPHLTKYGQTAGDFDAQQTAMYLPLANLGDAAQIGFCVVSPKVAKASTMLLVVHSSRWWFYGKKFASVNATFNQTWTNVIKLFWGRNVQIFVIS